MKNLQISIIFGRQGVFSVYDFRWFSKKFRFFCIANGANWIVGFFHCFLMSGTIEKMCHVSYVVYSWWS